MANRDDDFLARWSRRKADARQGLTKKPLSDVESGAQKADASTRLDNAPPPVPEVTAGADNVAAADPDMSFAEQLRMEESEPTIPQNLTPAARDEEAGPDDEAYAEFKDVDFAKLNYKTDYTRFMEKGVPEAVRKRALRALWSSNPILANIDGLNDYDEDFTDAALAVKGLLQTAYKPGTGYLTEEERLASYGDSDETPAEAGEDDGAHDAADAGEVEDLDELDDLDGEEEFADERDIAVPADSNETS